MTRFFDFYFPAFLSAESCFCPSGQNRSGNGERAIDGLEAGIMILSLKAHKSFIYTSQTLLHKSPSRTSSFLHIYFTYLFFLHLLFCRLPCGDLRQADQQNRCIHGIYQLSGNRADDQPFQPSPTFRSHDKQVGAPLGYCIADGHGYTVQAIASLRLQ